MISSYPIAGKSRKTLFIRDFLSSTPSPVDGDSSIGHLERCLGVSSAPSDSSASATSSSSGMFAPSMKGKYGAFGAVTLEKSKLDMTQKQTLSSPEILIIAGFYLSGLLSHDDDDYFDDFDDGDEGDDGGIFRRRIVLQELFDRKFLDAVLSEWQKTVMDLPAGIRQAFEMGLVSSAQLVKFLAINARPNTIRTIARGLPQGISRAFIGRMIADPAFLYRLLLEQATTIGCSAWWELKNRKDRIKQEWDLALINVLTAAACNAVVVWSLAPCRSYGNTFRFDLQNTLQKLPNNAAELCFVGLSAGAVQGALSNLCAKKKNDRLSVTMPSVRTNALGTGAFLGIYANLRYQLLCGIDRGLSSYFEVIGVALFFSSALRIMNVQVGETSRLAWLGIEADPLVQSDNLLKAYNRAPETNKSKQGSSWFISKNTIVSGLGFLGLPQGNGDSAKESDAPKPRRKRVVRKKVTTTA
uniref:Uncharacterized protein n=1 Tax=Chenopodium quinoa TaxID=63459 RepID=A0A803LJX0_CHEQI